MLNDDSEVIETVVSGNNTSDIEFGVNDTVSRSVSTHGIKVRILTSSPVVVWLQHESSGLESAAESGNMVATTVVLFDIQLLSVITSRVNCIRTKKRLHYQMTSQCNAYSFKLTLISKNFTLTFVEFYGQLNYYV